jgi:hypothetical protein
MAVEDPAALGLEQNAARLLLPRGLGEGRVLNDLDLDESDEEHEEGGEADDREKAKTSEMAGSRDDLPRTGTASTGSRARDRGLTS